jgi:hypothetical protein
MEIRDNFLGTSCTLTIEPVARGKARERYCDNDWIGGVGDPPICRRKPTRRLTLRDSQDRVLVVSECCARRGCLQAHLEVRHGQEALAQDGAP